MNEGDFLKAWLKPLLDQAGKRATLEGNFWIADQQYERGGANYRGYEAVIDDVVVPMDATKVGLCGEDFFTMNEMPGTHFATLLKEEGKTPRVQRFAKIILAREFNNIPRGVFDCDRHGGQLSVGEGFDILISRPPLSRPGPMRGIGSSRGHCSALY